MASLDEQIARLEDELREWDGSNMNERARKVDHLWALRAERDEQAQASAPPRLRRKPLTICRHCLASPAPFVHPRDGSIPLCRECISQMQEAVDFAAADREARIGDAGERAMLRGGRQPRGGR